MPLVNILQNVARVSILPPAASNLWQPSQFLDSAKHPSILPSRNNLTELVALPLNGNL